MALLVVDLSGELLDEFRRFAVNKHGKIYGVLKPEVELALRRYLDMQKINAPRKSITDNFESLCANQEHIEGDAF
jgi:hypothetical protein